MFYPARMNSVVIGMHSRWLMDVTSALHQQGELEIIDLKKVSGDGMPVPSLVTPREDIDRIISLQFRTDRISEILEPYPNNSDSTLLTYLFPPDRILVPSHHELLSSLISGAEELLTTAEPVVAINESLKKNRELQKDMEDRIGRLHRLSVLDIETSYLASAPYTHAVAGWIEENSLPLLQEWQLEFGADSLFLHTEKSDSDIVVFCIGTKAMEPGLEELTHKSWFFRITFPESYAGIPSELIIKEQEVLEGYVREEQDLLKVLSEKAGELLSPLRAIREELSIWRDRIEISRNYGSSRDVVYLHGWIRQKDTGRLSDLLKLVTHDEFFLSVKPAEKEDDVPVRYDNPKWLSPFEILTTTFSRPRYDEIDPTPFFAPVYLLFFGLMLGDAGYGIIIAFAGWLLYQGPGRNDPAFRDMSFILLCSGVADIILGTMQGGWFGDLLPRFFHITPPFVLIEPLNTPILLFQIALIIGTVHINLGLFLGFYENIRARMIKTAFQEQGIWFILQPSAAILLVMFFGWTTFSPLVVNLAIAGVVLGLLVLFYKKGPMGFFSLTGFLGDWLSYVRILALALATGGIAMTINILAEMIASVHPVMIIPAILFCIVGQFFNLIIQTLGSVIHALRLHYIEFFSKFYSGGGKEFVPFQENRIYTSGKREEIV